MGKYLLSAVEGNTQKLDGGAMFGNAPRAMWSKWIEPDEIGRIPLSCRCFLIETEDRKILFEAGVGAFFEPKLAERYGIQSPDRHLLVENLKKLKVAPEDITDVVLSHLHFDHAGGLLPTYDEIEKNGMKLIFANANYYVGKEAFERSLKPHPRDRASFLPELAPLLEKTGKLILINEGDSFFDGRLSFRFSHGHTPGQCLAIFKGEKEQMIFCGDLVPGTQWIHIPITMGYDRFAEMVIDEKTALYKEMDLDKTLFCFTHDAEIPASHIIQNEKKRYQASGLKKELTRYTL